VTVDYPEEIGRPHWQANRRLPEGRELIVLSQPAARWLLAMLTAILDPQPDPEGGSRLPAPMAGGAALWDGVRVRVQVGVQVHNPAEVGRPRWDRHELVVTIGDVVVYLSEAAARWLPKVLNAALAGEPDVFHGVGEA
jgi:hypothetical protein